MIKCPNCGSTAQPRRLGSTESENTVIEIYECGCGAKTQRFLQRTMDAVWSPTGTLIKKEKY